MTTFLLLTFLICLIHKIEFIRNVFTYGLQKKTYISNVDLYSIVIHWLNNILNFSSSLTLSFTYIGILKCPHSFLHSFTPSLIHSILSIYYIPRHQVKEKEEVRGWEQRHRGTRRKKQTEKTSHPRGACSNPLVPLSPSLSVLCQLSPISHLCFVCRSSLRLSPQS